MWSLLAVTLTLAVVTPSPSHLPSNGQVGLPDDCKTAFSILFDKSGKLADEKRYLEAAALRQSSGDIFQSCLYKGKAPHYGQYPLDGVGAYIIAADFWHLAGQVTEAQRSLAAARSALRSVLKRYPEASLPELARGELYHMRKMISDDDAGCWGVWQESDDEEPSPPVGVTRIAPIYYPCAVRNP